MTTERTPAQLHDADAVRAFILGGNAKFTLVSLKTSARYTFKVSRAKDSEVELWFVSSLYGPDNESDYAYLGIIGQGGAFRVTAKSRFTYDSPQARAFGYLWDALPAYALPGERLPAQLEFWHEGCCCRCGRTLTVPASIAAGIGPECASRV